MAGPSAHSTEFLLASEMVHPRAHLLVGRSADLSEREMAGPSAHSTEFLLAPEMVHPRAHLRAGRSAEPWESQMAVLSAWSLVTPVDLLVFPLVSWMDY